jgi:kynureninase
MESSQVHGKPLNGRDDAHVYTREYAASLDSQDPLHHIRKEFLIPSKADLKSTTLVTQGQSVLTVLSEWRTDRKGAENGMSDDPCVYLCGNSLGLQPRRTSERIHQYLLTWATQGVLGHFKPLSNSPLPPWLHVDGEATERMAPIVGAQQSEVAVMQTLTANLHFLMAAFYHPDPHGRHKILLESKAFPSDHVS